MRKLKIVRKNMGKIIACGIYRINVEKKKKIEKTYRKIQRQQQAQ